MSWRDNKNRGGYSRGGRGRGHYRGGGYRGEYRGGYRGGYENRPYNKRPPMYDSHDDKRTKFDVTIRLKETDVGIAEFISDHEHFSGIIKERFNDFHVHEINSNGEVAKLTTQEIPPEPEDLLDLDTLRQSLPQETLDNIDSLTKADTDINSIEIDVTDLNKDQRRIIHVIAKKSPSVESQTIEKDNKKLMILSKNNKKKRRYNYYRDIRTDWSQREGLFCQFLLHKVNMDTMDALNQMAIILRLKPNKFYYAGTKDRRARTTQWIRLKRVNPKDILEAGKKVHGAYVGNFKFVKEPLKLGNLNGNRFTIALRNVTGTNEEIDKAIANLRDNGFINYYGLQRFGTVANTPTHDIGKALLQGKWEEAVDLILKPRQGDQRDLAAARKLYAETKDARAACKLIYRPHQIEAKLLSGIHANGQTNLQGALDSIPRNTRLIYIHAYQSLIWNNIVSRRIKEYGRKPIVGDLVYEADDVKEEVENLGYAISNEEEENHDKDNEHRVDKTPKIDETDKPKQDEVDGNEHMEAESNQGEATSENNEQNSKEDTSKNESKKITENNTANLVETKNKEETAEVSEMDAGDVDEENGENEPKSTKAVTSDKQSINESTTEKEDVRPLPNVKILTEADLPNYTLADVIMPQPGWRVVYPPYSKSWYEDFLGKDGLDTDLKQKNKKYSLSGAYRKILQFPENLSWRIMHYEDVHDDLITCDIDELRGNNEGPKDNPEGKYKALILEMSLKSSTYATMALREVLKHDTSAEIQAAQSAAYHAQDEENKKNAVESKKVPANTEVKEKEVQMEVPEDETKDLPMEQESEPVSSTDNEASIKSE